MLKQLMIINNEFRESERGEYISVINPATEEKIGEVPVASKKQIDDAARAAFEAFKEWSTLASFERSNFLHKAADIVEKKAEEIGEILTSEEGKPLKEAVSEVKGSAEAIRYFAEGAKRIFGEIIPLNQVDIESMVVKQPIGVVAAISPWNYPVQLLAWKVGAALAAGCTVVAKPPSETPLSPLKFLECFIEAGIPEGVINGITGSGSVVGKELVLHPLVRKVSFTGSTEAGKKIMGYCSENVKRVTLELGGQSPLIVFADADFEGAIKGTVKRSFRNMGQVCNAINRIYIEQSIYEKFLESFVARTKELRIGNGLTDPDVDLGPMVNLDILQKVKDHIEDALSKGARLLCGGREPEGKEFEKGYFFEPAILADTNHDMLIMQEESFGPVVGVMSFSRIEEVIEWANSTKYGLAAYIYTSSIDVARRVCSGLECGNIGLNNVDVATIYAPYTGWKESGFGTDLGPDGIESYMETKHVKISYKSQQK